MERWRNWQTRYFEGVVSIATWEFESPPLHLFAEIAQLVEHNLAKVGVASSSLVFRSNFNGGSSALNTRSCLFFMIES